MIIDLAETTTDRIHEAHPAGPAAARRPGQRDGADAGHRDRRGRAVRRGAVGQRGGPRAPVPGARGDHPAARGRRPGWTRRSGSASPGPGEVVLLRMYGALGEHADSVVTPLLMPDTPVVTWWPGTPPDVPSRSPLGALAQRRITDAAAAAAPHDCLASLASHYKPGDTDLSWTRATPWRSLLAATLDQPHGTIQRRPGRGRAGQPERGPDRLLAVRAAAASRSRTGCPAGPGSPRSSSTPATGR